jgi:hypothetical protein
LALFGWVLEVGNLGWSELATTNAPIEDEAVQAVLGMNQKHILPYPKFLGFFSLFFAPKIFLPTYLPPTFLPFPISLLLTSPFLLIPPHFVFTPLLELRSA